MTEFITENFNNIGGKLHILTNIFVLFMLLVTAVAIAISRNLLVSTIYFTIFSLLMALMYIILSAPDVAITEAAIGAGISSVLFIATLILTGEEEKQKTISSIAYVSMIVTGVALSYTVLALPNWGVVDNPTNQHVAPFYIEKTSEYMGFPNIVTAILASFRGFDTLGEVFVVFAACIAVYTLLHGRVTKKA